MPGWQDAPEVAAAAPAWARAPEVQEPPNPRTFQTGDIIKQGNQDAATVGLLRGGKDIVDTGAKLLAQGWDKLTGGGEAARIQQMNDAGKAQFDQQYQGNDFAQGGRTGGQIAATLPVGGALAAPVKAVAAIAPKLAPFLGPLAEALSTGGMRAQGAGAGLGPVAGGAVNLATRAAGGAATGGASAGLVDPSQAETGATIGAVLPVAAKLAGATGTGIRRAVSGPAQSADLQKAIADAHAAGFVIPPSQARPNLINRTIEGFAGKASTAQNASARNAEASAGLVAADLGLPPGTKITREALTGIRQQAVQAYQDVKTLGTMQGDKTFNNQMAGLKGAYEGAAKDFPELANPELSRVLDSLKQPQFKASSAIDAIGILREKADQAFANRNKGDGKALRQAATAMEDLVERNLRRMNSATALDGLLAGGSLERGSLPQDALRAAIDNPASQTLANFRAARQTIAKTYSVEKALNPETGAIDARVLAAELRRGKPLSGGMEQVARFANRFPKAAQPVEGMGSLPQTSPLDWHAAAAMSLATGNPIPMASVAARPATRALALAPLVQNRLVAPTGPSPLAALFANPAARQLGQLGYRSAPVALSDR